jgi:hypothetical protein
MKYRLLLALAGAALSAQANAAVNLIDNGDFEAGNTGFTSGYNYVVATGPTALWGEGTYSVGANSNQYHALWANVPAHGGNNYMIVNGAPSTSTVVWTSDTFDFRPGDYTFTAYVTNICCQAGFGGGNAVPLLTFTGFDSAADPLASQAVSVTDAPGTWYKLTRTFTVTSSGHATISLGNAENAYSGNDFGFDDISLTYEPAEYAVQGPVPEPASWALMLGGFGLVGGAMRRKRVAVRFA